MTHEERASAVLQTAIRVSVSGLSAASGSLIRARVESCLTTALARCREDVKQINQMIDLERESKENTDNG